MCIYYLQVQIVQVLQHGEVLSTDLTNHIVLEKDGLDGEMSRDKRGVLVTIVLKHLIHCD